MCYVNKMDRSGANFLRCIEMIKKRLGARPLPVQLPIGSEDNFKGMVDLVEMKALVWDSDDKDAVWQVLEITPDLADKLKITTPSDRAILASIDKYRTELIDTCLEQDDEAMEAYLTDGTVPSGDVLRKALRKGTLNTAFTIVLLCGSSYKNAKACSRCWTRWSTISRPRPTCRPSRPSTPTSEPIGERKCSDDEPFLGFGLQGDQRHLRRTHVHSGVFRCADQGRLGAEFDARQARENRPHGRNVCWQGSESRRGSRAPATSSPLCLLRTPRRAIRSATPRTRWCWNVCAFRTPSSACR